MEQSIDAKNGTEPSIQSEPVKSFLNLEMRKDNEELNLEFYGKLMALLTEYKYDLLSLRVSTNRW